MSTVSHAQNALLNYHPSMAWGLTSVFTGLTIFYVVFTNIPTGNSTKEGELRKVQFVPKYEMDFQNGVQSGAELENGRNAPEDENTGDMKARIQAWEAVNEINDVNEEKNDKYIYVGRTKTRLGNVIFEFISGLAIGRTLNRTVLFSRRFMELLQVFPNAKKHMRMGPMSVDSGLAPLPMIYETGAGLYDKWMYSSIPKDVNIRICCYFQSYKYFEDMTDTVRQILEPSPKLLRSVSSFKRQIKYAKTPLSPKIKTTFVGVHVRRGDISTRDAWKGGRLSAPKDQILAAMEYYRTHYENVHFIICSDDIKWCQRNLHGNHDVTYSPSNDAQFDLVLLSQCHHSIMTVGTYGWWGSWLANGTVVYYDYQNKPGSYYGRRLKNQDFFPPSWIPMSKLPDL